MRQVKKFNSLSMDNTSIDDDSLDIIEHFENLEYLSTKLERVVNKLLTKDHLKSFKYMEPLNKSSIKVLPKSVTSVHLHNVNNDSINQIEAFLEQNPSIRDVTMEIKYSNEIAFLIKNFRLVRFHFTDIGPTLYSFLQAYAYIHPEFISFAQPATDPDQRVYEILFNRLTNRRQLFYPYIKTAQFGSLVHKVTANLVESPQWMLDQISTFDEFQKCLCKTFNIVQLSNNYFNKVLKSQLNDFDEVEYLHIIVSTYNDVFQLGGNVEQITTIIQYMTEEEKISIDRQQFFQLYSLHSTNPQLNNQK
ncbi:hypothetical protein FGO68_gene17472 [Halteria grandinella]|uniref:Uncharacterized protein n=1 Tax=Halteria grandinella TaxID=5974 RepID=A0A8J8NX92_HALGN|nr:hypothetical protein FGO68_gene17472 [Halteria grandinella]